MKKDKKIYSTQIPHLLTTTADIFRTAYKEAKAPNSSSTLLIKQEARHMRFIADLFSELVEISYPAEEDQEVKAETHIINMAGDYSHENISKFLNKIMDSKEGGF